MPTVSRSCQPTAIRTAPGTWSRTSHGTAGRQHLIAGEEEPEPHRRQERERDDPREAAQRPVDAHARHESVRRERQKEQHPERHHRADRAQPAGERRRMQPEHHAERPRRAGGQRRGGPRHAGETEQSQLQARGLERVELAVDERIQSRDLQFGLLDPGRVLGLRCDEPHHRQREQDQRQQCQERGERERRRLRPEVVPHRLRPHGERDADRAAGPLLDAGRQPRQESLAGSAAPRRQPLGGSPHPRDRPVR